MSFNQENSPSKQATRTVQAYGLETGRNVEPEEFHKEIRQSNEKKTKGKLSLKKATDFKPTAGLKHTGTTFTPTAQVFTPTQPASQSFTATQVSSQSYIPQ